MDLQQEQKDQVRSWASEGCGLSEIQRRLADELGIKMTFMDVRFLVLDLDVEIKEKNKPEAARKPAVAEEPVTPPPADPAPVSDTSGMGEPAQPFSGSVRVEVDRVVKPGALVSGTAVFSDGVQSSWALDQMGRLSLQGPNPDYRPSPEDVQEFQQALQQELAKLGY